MSKRAVVELSSAALARAGVEGDPRDALYRNPTPEIRKKEAFVTWSAPKKAGHWKCPTRMSRQDFGITLAEKYDGLQNNGRSPPLARILVCKEPHTDRDEVYHYHAIIAAADKTNCWYKLSEELRKVNIAADVRVSNESRDGLKKMMSYLLIPSVSKHIVDRTPFMSEGFPMIGKVVEERDEAIRKMSSRPATNDDVFSFVMKNPDLSTPESIRDKVDRQYMASKDAPAGEYIGGDIISKKLFLFFSSKSEKWLPIVSDFIDRRDRMAHASDIGKSFMHFLTKAVDTTCSCSVENQFYSSMVEGMEYHQKCAPVLGGPGTGPLDIFGSWVENYAYNKFQNRKVGLMIIGAPGSGKSTLANCVSTVFPSFLVGSPVWEDTWPLDSLEDRHSLIMLNDFRCAPNINKSTFLNLLERKAGLQIGVKGQKNKRTLSNLHNAMWIMSTNYLVPTHGWREDDLGALEDRAFGRLVLSQQLPRRDNSAMSSCSRCAAQFMIWATKYAENPNLCKELGDKLPEENGKVPIAREKRPIPDDVVDKGPKKGKKRKNNMETNHMPTDQEMRDLMSVGPLDCPPDDDFGFFGLDGDM